MKIYDISQEVFGCQVYAGDLAPEKELLFSMETGGLYNLTAFHMCAHNGTHIDAPFHFIQGGKAVDSIDLDAFIGLAYVAEHHGIVSADDAAAILENAKKQNPEAVKRILIKGDAEVSSEAAKVFAASNMLLLIGCCGLDCEKSAARIATLTNDNTLREKTAALWTTLNGVTITSEMINCTGCRIDGAKTPFYGSGL